MAALAEAAARHVAAAAHLAVAERGTFRLALSGGGTPERLYRLLASDAWRDRVPWQQTIVLFADERAVPPDDPDSNYRLVRMLLLDPLGIDAGRVRRMTGEDPDLDAAARRYESELVMPLDLLVMGMGPDGHTASLFPGHEALLEGVLRCVAVTDSPKPPPRRLTLARRALAEARAAIVLVTGDDKAAALAAALDPATPVAACPAALLRGRTWLVDSAAARRLPPATAC